MRVLVTATLQMVGVQSIGSMPEPAVVTGWSSELKVRSASGAAQPGGAPRALGSGTDLAEERLDVAI